MPEESKTKVIEGAWRMTSYVREGQTTSLTGILLLTAARWSTLYFVPQTGTGEKWGSAESGRYTINGDELTFHHELTFQGGGGKKLLIDSASSTVETCRIVLTPEILEIYFPSGNVVHCRRDLE